MDLFGRQSYEIIVEFRTHYGGKFAGVKKHLYFCSRNEKATPHTAYYRTANYQRE